MRVYFELPKPSILQRAGLGRVGSLPAAPEHTRHRAAFGVLLFTLIRSGEMLRLQWQDLDFATRTIHVRQQICRREMITPEPLASLRDRRIPEKLSKARLAHRKMAFYSEPTDDVLVEHWQACRS